MARYLLKSWKDKPHTFTRRIRWYEPCKDSDEGYRLELMDTEGTTMVFLRDKADADQLWSDFKEGKVTSKTVQDPGTTYASGTMTGRQRRAPGACQCGKANTACPVHRVWTSEQEANPNHG